MNLKSNFYLLFTLLLAFQSFDLQGQRRKKSNSIIESVNYDKNKNVTSYMVFPFGSVNLNGIWKDVKYNSVSKQKMFRSEHNIEMLVCINDCKNYPFSSEIKATNENFIEKFYEWEKDYYEKTLNLNVSIIERDSVRNYLICNLKGKKNEEFIDTILLISEKNCNIITLSMFVSKLMTTDDRIKLIKETFNN